MNKLIAVSMVMFAAGIRPGLAVEVKTLPPAVYTQMKDGKRIDKLFVSPDFKPSEGFRTGTVDLAVQNPYGSLVKFVPIAFARLAKPESPNVLTMSMNELTTKSRVSMARSFWNTTVGLEGQVVDPQGHLLVAFETREINREEVGNQACGQIAIERIVASLAQELGIPLAKRVKAKGFALLLDPPAAAPADPVQADPAPVAAEPAPATSAVPPVAVPQDNSAVAPAPGRNLPRNYEMQRMH